ncbi:murein biosynthesis integral membrane protein MurJ [Candidatus Saccharibacteria bacterium]|nr:MAG: murein biosynthesis integral membrane protein MurJ [Candidatus Saccharibacteria bacterium]
MSRVKRIVARANQRLTLQLAAGLLAGSSLLSSILGLFRDRLLNAAYYKSYPEGIDAYTVAFIIPDFMFFLLVSGALSVTFIPVLNQRLARGNKASAWRLSSSLVNFMALTTLAASLLIIIFAEPLVKYVVGPGLDEAGRGLAVSMMRVIAVNPFLFAIASVITSLQQAIGRFTFFALAPVVYNIGIIIGITVFTNGITILGVQVFEGGIMGVALGVVLGSIMQLILSAVGLIGMNLTYEFKIRWKHKGFKQVLRLLPARSFDQGIDYFNTIVETNLASRLAAGSIRAYQQAFTLHMVPVTLVGVAISTAAFPQMTERLATGKVDLFRKELQTVLRVIVWLALPIAVITFFTRGYLINFLVNGGDQKMASILGVLAIAIVFRSIYHIAARSFYAQQDTKTPLYISIGTISLNILLAMWFVLELKFDVYGLALAQSIVSIVEVAVLLIVMQSRIPGLLDVRFVHAIARMVSASGLMGIICYISVQAFQLGAQDQSFVATFPKFALIAILSLGSYVWISHIFQLSEPKPIIKRINNFFFKQFRAITK